MKPIDRDVLTMLRRLVFLVSAGMKEGWKKIGTKL
jgi:hypothetical protein